MLYQSSDKEHCSYLLTILPEFIPTILLAKPALPQTKAMGKKDEGTPETVRKAKVE